MDTDQDFVPMIQITEGPGISLNGGEIPTTWRRKVKTAWLYRKKRCCLTRCRTPGGTLTAYMKGMLNGVDNGSSDGIVGVMNGHSQAATTCTGAYRTNRNVIDMTYLVAGLLSRLPRSPYNTAFGGSVNQTSASPPTQNAKTSEF